MLHLDFVLDQRDRIALRDVVAIKLGEAPRHFPIAYGARMRSVAADVARFIENGGAAIPLVLSFNGYNTVRISKEHWTDTAARDDWLSRTKAELEPLWASNAPLPTLLRDKLREWFDRRPASDLKV